MQRYDISEYKYELAQMIINSDRIVKAIDSHAEGYNTEKPDSLLNVNVFSHIFIPKIQTSTETYIMFSCDVSNISSQNPTYHSIKLTVRVMAHKDMLHMKNERSSRIDYISNEIVNLLEGSSRYGYGPLRLNADREIILNENYIFRELVFKTFDIVGRC